MVRGVECELRKFNAEEFDDAINAGWRATPAEEVKIESEVVKPAKKKSKKK